MTESILLKNRLAASKCRQRKEQHIIYLETQFKERSDKKKAKLILEIVKLRSYESKFWGSRMKFFGILSVGLSGFFWGRLEM